MKLKPMFRIRVAALALATVIEAPSFATELTMYRERNFRGAMMVLKDAGSNISFSPRALRVGEGGSWLICPRPFFGGQCKIVETDTANLSLPRAFSGTVKSARPVATPEAPPASPVEAQPPRRPDMPTRPDLPPRTMEGDPKAPKT